MSLPSTRIIDHIIHLTPPGSIDSTTQQFKSLGFNVLTGGVHADGLTQNALIVLGDGVYLELLCFTREVADYPTGSPERLARESHWWASKKPGWIDYAFLGDSAADPPLSQIINHRASEESSDIQYQPEVPGGRRQPDGELIKWVLTSPPVKQRGTVPFFCADVTPRERRVPLEPPSNAEHPNKAIGVAFIRLLASATNFSRFAAQLTSALGVQPMDSHSDHMEWPLQLPAGTVTESQLSAGAKLVLDLPKYAEEHQALSSKGLGIYEIALWVGSGKEAGLVRTPYGFITLLPGQDAAPEYL